MQLSAPPTFLTHDMAVNNKVNVREWKLHLG